MFDNDDLISIAENTVPVAEQAQKRIEQNSGSVGGGFAFVVAGYPGAGKTTAAKQIVDVIEKDAEAYDVTYVDIDGLVDGDTERRSNAPKLLDDVAEEFGLVTERVATVDAAHSLEEIVQLAHFFDRLGIIFIESNSLARHTRLIDDERAKDDSDMDSVSREALRSQDREQGAVGVMEIEEHEFYDTEVENVGLDESEFLKYVRYAARDLWNEHLYGDSP